MANAEDLFHFGIDILKTVVDATTRTIVAQIGDVVHEVNEGDGAEWIQHIGFISRPGKPVAKKCAAQGWAIRRRGRDVVFASRDLRGLELAGEIDDGETCVYAAGPDGESQGRILIKKNGSINLYTRKGNTKTGAGMVVAIDPMTDTISIVNSKGFGLVIDGDGVKLTSKGAAVSLTEAGAASVIGKGATQIDGKTVTLGANVVPVANAALKGPTGISGSPSLKVMIE